MRSDRRRHSTDAGLKKHMRRRAAKRIQQFGGYQRITLHDEADRGIAFIGRAIGNDDPTVAPRRAATGAQRVLVTSGYGYDFRALSGDCAKLLRGNTVRDEHPTLRAHESGARGNRTAVVAGGRGGKRRLRQRRLRPGEHLRDREVHTAAPRQRLRARMENRIRTAESLEASQTEARPLVLDPDLTQSPRARQIRQSVQRRRGEPGTHGQRAANTGGGLRPSNGAIVVLIASPLNGAVLECVMDGMQQT